MLLVVCVPTKHHEGESSRVSAVPMGTDPEIHTVRPGFVLQTEIFCLENGSPWDF